MKKCIKKLKKLELNRETIRILSEAETSNVGGGVIAQTAPNCSLPPC